MGVLCTVMKKYIYIPRVILLKIIICNANGSKLLVITYHIKFYVWFKFGAVSVSIIVLSLFYQRVKATLHSLFEFLL